MRLIPLKDIQVPPDRQRKDFDESLGVELQESIAQIGLQLPLVVRRENGHFILVSGERRLRALTDMYALGQPYRFEGSSLSDCAPCLEMGELTPLQAMECEYDENVKRKDLTWDEKARATELLDRLRRAQADLQGLPPPTVREIGEERYETMNPVAAGDTARMELIVAQHLDDPEIKDAGGLKVAFKILQRREQRALATRLAEKQGLSAGTPQHSLHNVDCFAWMKACPEAQFDIVLTDPPYGIDADQFGDSDGRTTLSHTYSDAVAQFDEMLPVLCRELFRISKPDAHLYWFCDIDWFWAIRSTLGLSGWKPFRTPLVWHKPTAQRMPWPQLGPRRNYELIIYAIKGAKPIQRIAPDVITCLPDTNLGHAAQKPVELFVDLLNRSALPGDRVLDPFCGSGTIFPAADRLKLRATGIEQDKANYGIALKRLEALK